MHLPFAVVFLFAILGRSVWVAAAENGNTNVLDEDLFNRALAHAAGFMPDNHGLVERLRNGEVEALFDVAKSMNDSGDKISSVLIWHVLADDGSQGDDYEKYDGEEGYDYEGHIPSALALGFSYYDVDKPRSLHYFLMATSADGRPHQAAMYNAGRLFIEMNDPSSALAYIRSCATLDRSHPSFAKPQLSMTCKQAYETLSAEIVKQHTDMGLEEAVECFVYASFDDFPLPNTNEFQTFDGAMKNLQKYAEIAGGKQDITKKGTLNKAIKYLQSAIEGLLNLQSKYRYNMSQLQLFLIGYIIEKITAISTQLLDDRDEL